MISLIKLSLVFLFVIYLLWRNWNLGWVMLLGSLLIGLLYKLDIWELIGIFYLTTIDGATLKLILALVLIMALENILRRTHNLKRMVTSLKEAIRNQRIVTATLPAILGLLPSAGGALFSAPMVEEAGEAMNLSPEQKSFINYWFRHLWEYILPLFPGLILAAAIAEVPLNQLISAQFPLPLAAALGGVISGFKGIRYPSVGEKMERGKGLKSFLVSIWPIATTLFAVVILKVDVAWTMVLTIGALFLLYRYKWQKIVLTFQESISPSTLFLVLGTMIFKNMFEKSGAINGLLVIFSSPGFPISLIIFALPFLVGLLTGLTMVFVGITFPIILPFLDKGPFLIKTIAFAFASGYLGVLLSPVHLCLILTKDYFKANFGEIYRLMILPSLLLLATALLIYLL